jgi:uncharacterized membrane protein
VARAIAGLNLNWAKIAFVGALSLIILIIAAGLSINFLPNPIGVAVSLLFAVLIFLAYVFGRVVIQAATGKYLQKLILKNGKSSESVALLLGAIFWTIVLSIPFLWTITFVGLLVTGLGLVIALRPLK